jgi:hypothetical protein
MLKSVRDSRIERAAAAEAIFKKRYPALKTLPDSGVILYNDSKYF